MKHCWRTDKTVVIVGGVGGFAVCFSEVDTRICLKWNVLLILFQFILCVCLQNVIISKNYVWYKRRNVWKKMSTVRRNVSKNKLNKQTNKHKTGIERLCMCSVFGDLVLLLFPFVLRVLCLGLLALRQINKLLDNVYTYVHVNWFKHYCFEIIVFWLAFSRMCPRNSCKVISVSFCQRLKTLQ